VVDVNTTVFNKQLEELESLADSTGLYDDQQEDDEEEVQAEPSMEWRRAALEEGYSRVKRAKGRPVDPNKVYEIGTLLFEPAEGKFGRVKRSVPGYLCIQFLRGGEREYGRRPDVETYLRENHRGKTASELATQLGLTETEVQGHLNRLGLVRVDSIPGLESPAGDDHAKEAKAPKKSKASKDNIPGMVEEEFPSSESRSHKAQPAKGNKTKLPAPARDEEDVAPLKEPLPPKGKDHKSTLPQKAKTQVPTKAPAPVVANKSVVGSHKTGLPGKSQVPPVKVTGKTIPPPVKGKSQLPVKAAAASGKTTIPPAGRGMTAEDANKYIQKHFQAMSNRDLAAKTGLSEHTIRRKLGEWGLKRTRD
jgi:DNA-binding CsgD family transcriptional regulator